MALTHATNHGGDDHNNGNGHQDQLPAPQPGTNTPPHTQTGSGLVGTRGCAGILIGCLMGWGGGHGRHGTGTGCRGRHPRAYPQCMAELPDHPDNSTPPDPVSVDVFVADAIPVESTGQILVEGIAGQIPAVMLATEGRADVTDLARVHATEGIGDVRCGFGVYDVGEPHTWLVRFEVAVDHPVHCRFHFVITWSDHAAWLHEVARHEAVAVGTGGTDGNWLVLNVDRQRLEPVLDLLGSRHRPQA